MHGIINDKTASGSENLALIAQLPAHFTVERSSIEHDTGRLTGFNALDLFTIRQDF
jgi:hypothetical protein